MKYQTTRLKYLLGLMLLLFTIVYSCRRDSAIEPELGKESLTLVLKWNQGYDSETQQNAITGLNWCFSFLGASLPPEYYPYLYSWLPDNRLVINLGAAGFNDNAQVILGKLISRFRASEEYTLTGAMDAGRFIMLVLNSSRHYYAITGAQANLSQYLSGKNFTGDSAGIVESGVSIGNRIIRTQGEGYPYFLAQEGDGLLGDHSFKYTRTETMELMSNGQYRYVIFNADGLRADAVDHTSSLAGKPAKCLWCHEINIQPSFDGVTEVPGYLSPAKFNRQVANWMKQLGERRKILNSVIDFARKNDHTQMELLYISFMEPSAERLAKEWRMTPDEVRSRLAAFETHVHSEFPFLGQLYYRSEIDTMAPFKGLRVPSSAREISAYEPDFLH